MNNTEVYRNVKYLNEIVDELKLAPDDEDLQEDFKIFLGLVNLYAEQEPKK